VALTRHRSWKDVQLVSPLYSTQAERAKVIDVFRKLASPDAKLVAEMQRLTHMAQQTEQALQPLMLFHGFGI